MYYFPYISFLNIHLSYISKKKKVITFGQTKILLHSKILKSNQIQNELQWRREAIVWSGSHYQSKDFEFEVFIECFD